MALVFLASCRFDASVPAGANITCDDDAHCPEGWLCQKSVAHCVRADLFDELAPFILDGSVVLGIAPGRENPLAAPLRLGRGSTATIAFSVSEPLASASLLPNACGLDCAGPQRTPSGYATSCAISATAPVQEGPCALEVELVDLAQNRATGSLAPAGLVVDVTAPPPPDTATEQRVVYQRAPWGAEATAGAAGERLVGSAGAALGASWVLARSLSFSRGMFEVQDGGAFGPAQLAALDTPELEVASVDEAGNLSTFVRVEDGEWVATLGGKVSGSPASNPHAFETYLVESDAVVRTDGVEHDALEGLAAPGGTLLSVRGGAAWTSADYASRYVSTEQGHFAYDSARARLVGFGGYAIFTLPVFGSISSGSEVTAEWTGRKWVVTPTAPDPEGDGTPGTRWDGILAYDIAQRRVLLHGGRNFAGDVYDDTWAWNGQSWRYVATGPGRIRASAFWNQSSSQLVLAGGLAALGGAPLGETWAFDGKRWQAMDAGFSPRADSAAVYLPFQSRGFLFGGRSADGGLVGELLAFDGTRWQPVDAGPGPGPRAGAAFLWNPERRRAWLVGGTGPAGALKEIWEFDGAGWVRLPDAVVAQFGPTTWHGLHGARGQLMSTRAEIAQNSFAPAPVWTRDGQQTEVQRVEGAVERSNRPSVACTPRVGGCIRLMSDGGIHRHSDDGWAPHWSPNWTPASFSALVWNPQREKFLAVLNVSPGMEAWELDVDGGVVRVADPPSGFTLTIQQATLLQGNPLATGVGGRAALYADGGWTLLPNIAVPNLSVTFSASEAPDASVVVTNSVQGIPVLSLVYRGDAGSVAAPAPLTGSGALALDPSRGRVLQVGGASDGTSPSPLVQERLADGSWRTVPFGRPEGDLAPDGRRFGSLSYDAARGSLLLTGGSDALNALGDTWWLDIAHQRPAGVFRVQRAAMGLSDRASVRSVELRANAGGRGFAVDGGVEVGVRARVWLDGRWSQDQVQVAPGALSSPRLVELRVSDPAVLQALVPGQPELLFELAPVGNNGADFAELSVDYVEATVRYRREPP